MAESRLSRWREHWRAVRPTLWIGPGAPPLPELTWCDWDEVPERLPSAFQFSVVVVVPEAGTASLQLRLVEQLKRDAAVSKQTRTVWILNEHASSDVLGRVGAGHATSFQHDEAGELHVLLGGHRRLGGHVVAKAIADVPSSAAVIARWKQHQGVETSVPAGVLTGDLRWCFIPPHPEPHALLHRVGMLRQYAPLVVLTLLLLFGAWSAYRATPRARHDFLARVRALWPVASSSADASELVMPWEAPERALAARAFDDDRAGLLSLAPELSSDLDPFELWRRQHEPANADAAPYFQLALLSGDLQAAYRIVTSLDFKVELREEWAPRVTRTLWQTAVGALHELDFPRARQYCDLYLAAIDHINADVHWPGELAPERTRTLARILQRELRSGRIQTLCATPGVGDSFGHLLGGDWGEALPEEVDRALLERRAKNAAQFCTGPALVSMPYASLGMLRAAPTAQLEEDPCEIAPIECEFLRLSLALDDEGATDNEAISEALHFSAECSYLADDLLFVVLDRAGHDEDGRLVIRAAELQRGLSCFDRGIHDFRGAIAEQLGNIDCKTIDWTGLSRLAPIRFSALRDVAKRCGVKR